MVMTLEAAGHRDIAQVHCRRVLAFAHGATGKSDMFCRVADCRFKPWIFVAELVESHGCDSIIHPVTSGSLNVNTLQGTSCSFLGRQGTRGSNGDVNVTDELLA